MTKVAVVAEHALLAEALATRIDVEDELSVVATATDGAAATDLALRHEVDVIVLDIDLPHEDGVDLGRRLHKIRPDAQFVVLSGPWDPVQAARALRYGVRGWVPKSGPVDELLRAIRAAVRDETRIPPRLLTELGGLGMQSAEQALAWQLARAGQLRPDRDDQPTEHPAPSARLFGPDPQM